MFVFILIYQGRSKLAPEAEVTNHLALSSKTCYTGCLNKKLTLFNSLPIKNCETFLGNFHKYVWLKVIYHMTPKIWKYFMLEWVLATFVKGMKIRLRKSQLSVLAEWKAPQRRNCRWCDEFMINSDGYWLYCVRHGLFKQKFMNKWACMTF